MTTVNVLEFSSQESMSETKKIINFNGHSLLSDFYNSVYGCFAFLLKEIFIKSMQQFDFNR